MQKEKFYRAQELHKEINQIETTIEKLNAATPFEEVRILEKLSLPMRQLLTEKIADLLKKELQKIIKQKEKEFNDL